jgi:peptide/nickel transport system permease protein
LAKQNDIVSGTDTTTEAESYYTASQAQLMWWRFRKHKLAIVSGVIVILYYLIVIFCEMIAPYSKEYNKKEYALAPPQHIRFIDGEGRFHLRPFVFGIQKTVNQETLRIGYDILKDETHPIRFFTHGTPYRMWGVIETDIHLFGIDDTDAMLLLFGGDNLGRDVFSRTIYGTRISLTIGLVGVTFSLILGVILGGMSGYFGGVVDVIIQRLIEFIRSIPAIPLWLVMAAALPASWPALRVYFGITIILSLRGWTVLGREIRGKFLSLREEDFVTAARLLGAKSSRIIFKHLVPSTTSHLIARLTLALPVMIISETALSFLGLGLKPPIVSWGVLLRDAQNLRTIAQNPWLLIPGIAVVIVILAFNFLGDGLRDAADPYKQ